MVALRDTDHWWRGGSAVGNPIRYVTAGRGDLEDHEGRSEDGRAPITVVESHRTQRDAL